MKKVGAILFVFVLALAFVAAQDNESDSDDEITDPIDKAYQCLQDEIDSKEESALSLQDAIFSTLALGSQDKLQSLIEDQEGTNCWPKASCSIKETSQMLLAYNRINKNTDDIEEWLNSKKQTPTDLTWYLQIDISNHSSASCDLSYDDHTYTINVNEDMTLSGAAGSCLSVSSSGYWLQINNNCLDKTFETSCNGDFITSLLYQRSGSSSYFVSPTTHSASALGTTQEIINSNCFSTGSSCDYEGTLWATIALDNLGKETNFYRPYLAALAESNQRYFPSTFLYILTNGNDQFNEIIQAQQQGKYWQAPSTPYNRFYDTSLALMSLSQSSATTEVEAAKEYLIDIQTPDGCWNNNNIRDTAFVLYAGWPRGVSSAGGDGGGGTSETCQSQGYSCVSGFTACLNAGGNTLYYNCEGLNVCCSVSPQLESCAQQGGTSCSSSQTCSGTTIEASDGSCCLGSCETTTTTTESECESQGGSCYASCTSNEEEISSACESSSEVCCKQTSSTGDSSSNIWTWIIILTILIILVAVGIVYRKKLQLMLYKMKKKKGGPSATGMPGRRPPFPPASGGLTRPPIRRPMRGMPIARRAKMIRAQPRKSSRADKEFEDTLKKLKDMGN